MFSPSVAARSLFLLVFLAGCGGADSPAEDDGGFGAAPAGVATLPQVAITTENGARIDSKDEDREGTLAIADAAGTPLYAGPMEVHGRGNYTWELPKKPYKVKLDDKAELLGMPSNKHWVLLANYADKTLMRNDVTFALSEAMGMAWTPRSRFVELTVNGSYDGVYQLTEHVRVDKNRVDIDELDADDTSASKITGGYLLEV
ncbi:MAG: CotH kinase family protein, partial [Burkholderiaceae bacterium]